MSVIPLLLVVVACGGGQSFDDGGNPLSGVDETEVTTDSPTTPSAVDVTDEPTPGTDTTSATDSTTDVSDEDDDHSPGVGIDAGVPTPSQQLPGPMSELDASAGRTEPEPEAEAEASDGGSPGSPVEIAEDIFDPPAPGLDESLGRVEFEFSVEEAELYCTNSGASFQVFIEDEDGNVYVTGSPTSICGAVDCSSCELAPDCPGVVTGDVYYPNFFGAGGTASWSGERLLWNACSSGGEPRLCLDGSYAPAGRYTAVFCTPHGETWDSPPDECRPVADRDCMRVAFDYPTDEVVTGVMPPGGTNPEDWTTTCGNKACNVTTSYCDTDWHGDIGVGVCRDLPAECLSDVSCDCLQPTLPDGRTCAVSPTDDSLRVHSDP